MKYKSWSIIALLFWLVPLAAENTHPWLEFAGCYKTISRNGHANPADQQLHTQISFNEESFGGTVRDLAGNKLPGLDILLFINYDAIENTYFYNPHTVFSQFGVYSQSGNVKTHDVAGSFIFDADDGSPQPFTLTAHTEIEPLSDERLRIYIKRQVPEVPNGEIDLDDVFVLEKTTEDCVINGLQN